MHKVNRRIATLTIGLAAASALSFTASAQDWPQRTVHMLVPLPPGTAIDVSARLIAEHLSVRWKQPVATTSDNFLVIAASPKLKIGSLAELLKRAQASSTKLNWAATSGIPYFAFAGFAKSAGV